MPISATNWVTENATGFVPAGEAYSVSGAVTQAMATAGVPTVNIAASITAELVFNLPWVGDTPIELFAPYQQYNQPVSLPLNISQLTVYYTVATAALTAATCALYAVSYASGSPVVTTLLASGANGLSTATGTYAITIDLDNVSVPMPNSTVLFVLSVATAVGGTAAVNGVAFA